MRIAVLADTHIPKRAKTLPDSAWKIVKTAQVILHAGDVLTKEFLDQLAQIAPLYAVRGNNDIELSSLPETLEFELENINFAMIHDSGPKKQRSERMRKRFPEALRCRIWSLAHPDQPVRTRLAAVQPWFANRPQNTAAPNHGLAGTEPRKNAKR